MKDRVDAISKQFSQHATTTTEAANVTSKSLHLIHAVLSVSRFLTSTVY